jgi:hypothetical protein
MNMKTCLHNSSHCVCVCSQNCILEVLHPSITKQITSISFQLGKEMYSMQQKAYCILWLEEFKSYTNVWQMFSMVNPNHTPPIYTTVKTWDKCLKQKWSFMHNIVLLSKRHPGATKMPKTYITSTSHKNHTLVGAQ